MKRYIVFAVPALILGLIVMSFAGYRLVETQQVYQEADAAYEGISGLIRKPAAAESSQHLQSQAIPSVGAAEHETEEPKIFIPGFEIDFDMLKSINKDATAWLYSPDSAIDYPVMRADDYYYYLNHLPDGKVNANGSLFIDYNNAPDFSGKLTVIYGHHMKSGSMFGGLVAYKEQAYYDEHPYMYLYTEQGDFRIDLMYGFVVAAGHWIENAFMYEENADALLEYAARNTTFDSGVEHIEGDRVIALSTCSYEFNEARYVVVGILRPATPVRVKS